jgi:hypothetical protein
MFGIGADDSQGITKAANYTAMCKPADPNRQNYPQGVLTFGGPYDTKAVPVLNAVAKGLYN